MPRERLDHQLISLLAVEPTLTRAELAGRLARTYETIQRVLSHLGKVGKVKPGFVVTAEALDGLVNYWIMIQTRGPREPSAESDHLPDYQTRLCDKIRAELTSKPWRKRLVFRRIDILFGADWDIILLVSADSAQTIQSLITGYLRGGQCPEIVGTRTAWSTQTFTAAAAPAAARRAAPPPRGPGTRPG